MKIRIKVKIVKFKKMYRYKIIQLTMGLNRKIGMISLYIYKLFYKINISLFLKKI